MADRPAIWPPTAGLYKMRRARNSVFYAARVWYGPPHDPLTGEELDRSWRWQATLDGKEADLERVWPYCIRYPVKEPEYRFLLAIREWERINDPIEGQEADAPRIIDRMKQAPPF